MLSELKETNRKLREKLRDLKGENSQTSICPKMQEPSFRLPSASTSSVPAPASGRNNMLSDRAKHVRGEAAKRIDNLLHDWRDYKERADEELRRRMRTEQNLKEHLCHKERETNELSRELASLKMISKDQKKMIDKLRTELDTEEKCRNRCTELEMQISKQSRHITELNRELETEAKCRNRCTELEMQISKLSRHITELNEEIRARDELIRTTEDEKSKLSGLNAELRERNIDQKRKIELCEHDVNETRMELEILEEMVRALNERKVNIFANGKPADQAMSPINAMEFQSGQDYPQPLAHSSKQARGGRTPNSFFGQDGTQNESSDAEDRDRAIAERLSAMSALKSLRKDHNDKCDDLAEHIRKLKQENKLKESTISELKRTNPKMM